MTFLITDYDLYQWFIYFVQDMNQAYNGSPSLEALREIVETSVDAIVVINSRGLIQYVNRAAIFLFLYKQEDMLGQNISMLMPQPDKAKHDGYIRNYQQTGKRKIIGIGREVIAQKKDGSLFSCLLSLSEVNVDNNQYFTGIIHDISALKLAENELIELNKSLELKVQERTEKLSEVVNRLLVTNNELTQEIKLREKAEKALKKSEEELRKSLDKEKELSVLKSRFVTMASHEFRTPLSTILSSTNLIAQYMKVQNPEKVDHHVAKIKNTVNHLTGILNDFLSLGKWDEGKVSVEKTYFSWSELVNEVSQSLQHILKREQYFNLEIEDFKLYTDQHLLKNSMINLISNASKYSKESQEIKISSRCDGNRFIINVEDFGQGIPLTEQANMFERFFRASNVTNIEGTGLGLNLVQSYIQSLGGSISFVSEEGKGSIFTLELPQKI